MEQLPAAGQRLTGRAVATGVARLAVPAGYAAVATEEVTLGAAALAGAETGGLLTSELGPMALMGAAVGAGVGLLTAALTSG